MTHRPLEALLSPDDEGWRSITAWVSASSRGVEVLPPSQDRRPDCLRALQVTTRSVLGAMAWHTSGVLLDHRWLRLLGGFSASGLPDIATASGLTEDRTAPPPFIVIAQDVLGGLFAVNGHGLPCEPGEVAYFAPDSLAWQGLEVGNSGFVAWALTGDTETFYEQLRWPGWQEEASAVPLGSGLSVYPPLFTTEAQRDLAATSRRAVPWSEILNMQLDLAEQLDDVPEGAPIDLQVEGATPPTRRSRRT